MSEAPEAAPVRQAKTENVYDRSVTPQINAQDDVRAIQQDITRGDAAGALTRLQQETSERGLQGTSPVQQEAYRRELTEQLTRSGVLPALSIAAVQRLGDTVMTAGRVDLTKLNDKATSLKDKDPVQAALLSSFARTYEEQRRGGMTPPITDGYLRGRLETTMAQGGQALKDQQLRRDLTPLTDPKVFDAMAGMGRGVRDGRIEQRDLDAFRTKWNDANPTERDKFRAQFGTTEQQNRIDKFLKDTPKVDTPDNRRLGTIESNIWHNNAFTRETLTRGMGGPEAVQRLQQESQRRTDGRLPAPVEAVGNIEASRIRPNEGPHQVAKRMLEGAQFNDPAKAQRDLQGALGTVFDHRVGSAQLEGDKHGKVREAIRQGGNTELLNWFDKSYPGRDAATRVEAPAASDAAQTARDQQLRKDTSPLLDPKLFDAMAGMGRGVKDGRIEQQDLDAFRTRWNDTNPQEQAKFRAQFGTQEQQSRIDKFLKDTPKVDSADMKRLGISESNLIQNNAITRETLTRGMGGPDAAKALMNDLNRRPDGTLPKEMKPAPNLDETRIGRGEGPHHVANRMLRGSDMADPTKAQRDLQTALGTVFDHRQGSAQLEGDKHGKVREAIRQGGNTELLRWYDQRYPGRDAAAARVEAPATGDAAQTARDQQLRKDTSPLADPRLFDAMAGMGRGVQDGRIMQQDLDAFRAKWNDTNPQEQAKFRARFGTQEQQSRIDKFLKDTPKVDSADMKRLGISENNTLYANAITRETLTRGLGGPEATQNLLDDMRRRPDGSLPKPVTAATDLEATRIGRQEGPFHVAQRMLAGRDFADPAKAQRDMQAALGTVFDHKQGSPQLEGQKMEKVREAIRQSGNTELYNWYNTRYPQGATFAPSRPRR